MASGKTFERRVLVLGAGASKGCGFPLGSELLLSLQSPLRGLCHALSQNDEELAELERDRAVFLRTCRDSTFSSIDEMLARRVELRAPGALSLAAALVGKQLEVVRSRLTHSQWHRHFYQFAFRDSEAWHKSDDESITVVTFNYDLNLEVAIARHLSADFGLPVGQAWEAADDPRIVHVHGMLDLHDEIGVMLQQDGLTPPIGIDLIQRASRLLGMSTDEAERLDTESIGKAREFIWNATEIAFIGFGYDPRNLDRIGIGPNHKRWKERSRRLLGTAVNLSSEALNSAHEQFRGPIDLVDTGMTSEYVVKGFLRGTRPYPFATNIFPR